MRDSYHDDTGREATLVEYTDESIKEMKRADERKICLERHMTHALLSLPFPSSSKKKLFLMLQKQITTRKEREEAKESCDDIAMKLVIKVIQVSSRVEIKMQMLSFYTSFCDSSRKQRILDCKSKPGRLYSTKSGKKKQRLAGKGCNLKRERTSKSGSREQMSSSDIFTSCLPASQSWRKGLQ